MSRGQEVKLVAFDLDDTLTESKVIMDEQMAELLTKLLGKLPVAIISGAGFKQFELQVINVIKDVTVLNNLYILPTNGNSLYVYQKGEWLNLFSNKLSQDEVELIKSSLNKVLLELNLSLEPELWGNRIEDRGAQVTFSGLGQSAPIEKKELWDPDRAKRMQIREKLMLLLPNFQITVGGRTSIDITKPNYDKASAVEDLAKRLGVKLENVLYVGDALEEGGNDAVVLRLPIMSIDVSSKNDTAKIIEDLLTKVQ